jgi:molybdopterin-binding protein
MRTSARNHFAGHIADGEKIVSIITNESVDRLGLAVGKPATAIFKASGVIVGVE